jgi:hypothetical protein
MNAITSIFIPRIETEFNAEFIAEVFNRNDIAQVSRIYIKPYKSIIKKNGLNKYNRAYIDIKEWYSTEAAYNFIKRLINPNREARIIYSEDNWWPVEINNNVNMLDSIKRVLTVFTEKLITDDISTIAVTNDVTNKIDINKTQLINNIVANFKKKYDDSADIEGYLREMYDERDKWFSEQYIYDELGM